MRTLRGLRTGPLQRRLALAVALAASAAVLQPAPGPVAAAVGTGGPVHRLGVPSAAAAAALPADTCTLAGSVRTCELWARATTIDLPGAPAVPALGYADSATGQATVPGPVLVAHKGETLQVVLHNDLAVPTSLALPQLAAVPDIVGVSPGGQKTYRVKLDRPGTTIYEAGLTAAGPRQVAQGMAGALVVRPPAAGTAYGPGTAFDDEAVVVLQEVDPRLNANPTGFDIAQYAPTYRLINGAAFPDTAPVPTVAGHTVLVRYVNAGLVDHTMAPLGATQSVVGADAFRADRPAGALSALVPSGGTADALVDVPAGTTAGSDLPLYEPAGLLDNAGATSGGTVDFGGLMTFLHVS